MDVHYRKRTPPKGQRVTNFLGEEPLFIKILSATGTNYITAPECVTFAPLNVIYVTFSIMIKSAQIKIVACGNPVFGVPRRDGWHAFAQGIKHAHTA